MNKVLIDDRQVWCVCWQSPTRRSSSYWYFERETEATVAHQRLLSWETGQSHNGASGSKPTRG